MHFFGAQWKWKSWGNYSSTCLGCNSSFWRTWADEWGGKKNAADESNCFGLSGLFVVMSVHHRSEPLPRFQGGVLCSIMSAHGFPKTCHPEDEEATVRYQIPITTWRKMMVLMFHTLMDRRKNAVSCPFSQAWLWYKSLRYHNVNAKTKQKPEDN